MLFTKTCVRYHDITFRRSAEHNTSILWGDYNMDNPNQRVLYNRLDYEVRLVYGHIVLQKTDIFVIYIHAEGEVWFAKLTLLNSPHIWSEFFTYCKYSFLEHPRPQALHMYKLYWADAAARGNQRIFFIVVFAEANSTSFHVQSF